MLLVVVLLNLIAAVALATDKQATVPAILFSYKLSPGILRYRKEIDAVESFSRDRFSGLSKELLGKCNSDAYVFINQPGLRKQDFSIYKKEFISLQRYIDTASTALDLERVETLPSDTYDELVDYVSEKCKIDKAISIRGNDTGSFEPYIDTAKRVIRIDYPVLPENKELRRQAISDFDKFLRTILAQVPSPAQTVLYTALGELVPDNSQSDRTPIFPEIFRRPSKMEELEKNNHDLRVPREFNEHRPKFAKPEPAYVSLLDSQFISENYDLLRLILTSLGGFLVLQLVLARSKPAAVKKKQTKTNAGQTEPESARPSTISTASTAYEDKAGNLKL